MVFVKWLTTLGDVAMMGLLVYGITQSSTGRDIFPMLLLVVLCLFNLWSIWHDRFFGKTWLGLYIKRKRLEEQVKIENLESGENIR